jgi:hypothetical protein
MTEEITPQIAINEVYSIALFDASGETYAFEVNITLNGETFDAIHMYRANDPHGLSPLVKQWMIDNPDFPIADYVAPSAPTAEELRSQMPAITPRQLRLTLVRNGVSLASVTDAIAGLPEGLAKSETEISWQFATAFERNSATLLTIATALDMSPEAVDTLWTEAIAA